jgi:hypothetical protein
MLCVRFKMTIVEGNGAAEQPRTMIALALEIAAIEILGFTEQQSKLFCSLICSVAGQAVQTQLKLQEKHETVVRDSCRPHFL